MPNMLALSAGMLKKIKKTGDSEPESAQGGGEAVGVEPELDLESHRIRFEIQSLRGKVDRLELRVSDLTKQNLYYSEEIDKQQREHIIAHTRMKDELREKDDEIASLYEKLTLAEETRDHALGQTQSMIEKERIHGAEQMRQYQEEIMSLKEQLNDLVDFKVHKSDIEAELENTQKKIGEQRKEHQTALADLERKIIQEKDRLRKEMLAKMKEAKESLLKLTDAQLASTTKKTMAENEQMAVELAYQSKITESLLIENHKLKEEVAALKRKIAILEENEVKSSTRAVSAQKVIKILTNKMHVLQSGYRDRKTGMEDERDIEIQTLINQLGEREERISDLTQEIEILKHSSSLETTNASNGFIAPPEYMSTIMDTTNHLLAFLGEVKMGKSHAIDTASADTISSTKDTEPSKLIDIDISERENALRNILSEVKNMQAMSTQIADKKGYLPPIASGGNVTPVGHMEATPQSQRHHSYQNIQHLDKQNVLSEMKYDLLRTPEPKSKSAGTFETQQGLGEQSPPTDIGHGIHPIGRSLNRKSTESLASHQTTGGFSKKGRGYSPAPKILPPLSQSPIPPSTHY